MLHLLVTSAMLHVLVYIWSAAERLLLLNWAQQHCVLHTAGHWQCRDCPAAATAGWLAELIPGQFG